MLRPGIVNFIKKTRIVLSLPTFFLSFSRFLNSQGAKYRTWILLVFLSFGRDIGRTISSRIQISSLKQGKCQEIQSARKKRGRKTLDVEKWDNSKVQLSKTGKMTSPWNNSRGNQQRPSTTNMMGSSTSFQGLSSSAAAAAAAPTSSSTQPPSHYINVRRFFPISGPTDPPHVTSPDPGANYLHLHLPFPFPHGIIHDLFDASYPIPEILRYLDGQGYLIGEQGPSITTSLIAMLIDRLWRAGVSIADICFRLEQYHHCECSRELVEYWLGEMGYLSVPEFRPYRVDIEEPVMGRRVVRLRRGTDGM